MSKELSEQEGPPSFIQTSPLGQDLLEGQAQENTATTIARLIEREDAQGKLIGLDGPWGSGKSNLIQIVESKLSDSHHFFVYDSWGHQEDLHRRSFLEELTSDLCDSGLVKSKAWKKKLRELLSEKRETLTRTIPRLGDGTIMTALVVVFTPIFQSISQMVDGEAVSWFVRLLPLLTGVAFYGFDSLRKRRLLRPSEFLSLYNDKELTNEVLESVYESQPSVRQFQNWMRDLGNALKKKRLVVVFDNMDRLPPDKLRELWSSIHTFFTESSFTGIWVMVPFDRNHLSMAFEKNPNARGTRLSEEFLRKTFSVVFRVPPPVMTDWHRFFERKFDEAFEDEAGERLEVRKIFDQSGMQVTPRSIIAFINELVGIRLASQDKIPLRHVATFLINRKKILKDPVGRILDGSLLGIGASALEVDAEFADSIAALAYGVPLASASQVALYREIQNSVGRRDTERLLELSTHPGFVDVFEQVARSEDVAVVEAIAAVEFLEETGTDTGHAGQIRGIWDEICRRQISETVSEQRFTETYHSLLIHISEKHRLAFVRYLVRGYAQVPEGVFSGNGYYSALSNLHESVHANGMMIDVFAEVRPHVVGANIFNEFVRSAGSQYKKFRVSCDTAEMREYLIENSRGKWQELGSTSHLAELVDDYDFAEVEECLEQRIARGQLSVEDVGPFYELYKAVSSTRPLKLPANQYLAGLVSQVGEDSPSLPDLLAMRLAKGRELGNIGGVSASLIRSGDEDVADRVARCIEYYEEYGNLLINSLSWSPPLMQKVLSNMTLSPNVHLISNIAEALRKYDALYGLLNVESAVFLRKLDSCGEPPIEGNRMENIAEFLQQGLLFEHAVAVDCDLTRYLVETAVEWFVSLDVNTWRNVYADQHSNIFKVLCLLLESEKLEEIPENADAAYRDFLDQFVKGNVDMDADGWGAIYRKSDKRRLKPIAKDIRDEFIFRVDITPQKFGALSEILFTHADLKARSADAVRRILGPVATDPDCLQMIVGNRDLIPIIKEAGDDASTLKDIVRQKSTETGASEELRRFSNRIGS